MNAARIIGRRLAAARSSMATAALVRGGIGVCMVASAGALAATPAAGPNAAFTEAAHGLAAGMNCPPAVEAEIQRSLKSGALPPQVAMHGLFENGKKPEGPLATILAVPEMAEKIRQDPILLKTYAAQVRMSQAELLSALSGARREVPPTFMSRTAAELKIDNGVPSICNSHCESDIGWNVVLALSIWNGLCLQCSEDFLTVVSLGADHWVRPAAMEWLRQPGQRVAADFPLKDVRRSRLRRAAGSAGATTTNDNIQLYELVAPEDPAIGTLCAIAAPSGARPAGLDALQGAFCKRPDDVSRHVRMRIALLAGATSCGPSDAFIGCGQPDNTVELTFQQTRYSFIDVYGQRRATIGAATGAGTSDVIDGTAVMLHEVGHWFGLSHIAYRPDLIPDVMQETLAPPVCLSALSVLLVQNMTAAQHAERLQRGAGLRRPPKGAH